MGIVFALWVGIPILALEENDQILFGLCRRGFHPFSPSISTFRSVFKRVTRIWRMMLTRESED
jgi:hypothetical protein